jgi:hypothetical protein
MLGGMNDIEKMLEREVKKQYGCDVTLEESVPVTVEATFDGKQLMNRALAVSIFNLEASAVAKQCFAWKYPPKNDAQPTIVPSIAIAPEVPAVGSVVATVVKGHIIYYHQWDKLINNDKFQLRVSIVQNSTVPQSDPRR